LKIFNRNDAELFSWDPLANQMTAAFAFDIFSFKENRYIFRPYQ